VQSVENHSEAAQLGEWRGWLTRIKIVALDPYMPAPDRVPLNRRMIPEKLTH
jgi:hypothetical protein